MTRWYTADLHLGHDAIIRHCGRPFRSAARFAKKQQMQWTPRGAHLLLQTRTRPLDGTLQETFER